MLLISHAFFFPFKNTFGSDYIIRIRLLVIFGLYNPKLSFTIILIRLWFASDAFALSFLL